MNYAERRSYKRRMGGFLAKHEKALECLKEQYEFVKQTGSKEAEKLERRINIKQKYLGLAHEAMDLALKKGE